MNVTFDARQMTVLLMNISSVQYNISVFWIQSEFIPYLFEPETYYWIHYHPYTIVAIKLLRFFLPT